MITKFWILINNILNDKTKISEQNLKNIHIFI